MKSGDYERFHIKIDSPLKARFVFYAMFTQKNYSDAINSIFSMTFHFIEKYSFILNKIKLPEEPIFQTDNLDIFLRSDFKNFLYKLQGDFNLRSKASVTRFVLRLFLDLFERKNFDKLRRFFASTSCFWRKIKESRNEWRKIRSDMRSDYPHSFIKTYNNDLKLEKITLVHILKPPP